MKDKSKAISRRSFLKQAAAGTVGAAAAFSIPQIVQAAFAEEQKPSYPKPEPGEVRLSENTVILFQGDSITDFHRDRSITTPNSSEALGYGYAAHAAGLLLFRHASSQPLIYNRGVSGDKVYQLRDRWQQDCYDLKPEVLSILIGVNDFWHAMNGNYDGTPEVYRRDYLNLIDDTLNRMPDLQLVIGEPFAVNEVKAVDDSWYPKFYEIQDAAREVAETYNAIFVPYQKAFDEAMEHAPASYWTNDGVHTTLAGSQLMAYAWMKMTGL